MANNALAVLELALRERKLDRTLTTALPPLERADAGAHLPFDIAALDDALRGGLPRGQLSEMTGPQSSGRTTLLLQLISAVTRRGDIAALIDTHDRLDVASAAAAGIDFDRFLWVRGEPGSSERVVDRALKALTLVLHAGGFALAVIDLGDVRSQVIRNLPFTTWLRIQRVVEGSDTACLLIGPEPLARSAGGLTVMLTGHTTWNGTSEHSRWLSGLDADIRIVSPRRRADGEVRVEAVMN